VLALGHGDGDVLIVPALPHVPLLEPPGLGPRSLTLGPRGQVPIDDELAIQAHL